MIIRNETISDIAAISEVTIAAFKNLPISNHTEQYIINALRNANALTISLVAEINGKVVGHIAFSARNHFGWNPRLVRTWSCVGIARISAERCRQSTNP